MEQFFLRDANRVPITGLGLVLKKTITFVAGTTGAIGTTTLFTVTGHAALNVFGFCTTDLAGAGTLEIGLAGSTACLANQQAATAIDAHEVWHDSVLAIGGQVAGHNHVADQNVILTIATNTVSAGVIDFYCLWFPLAADSLVEAA